MPNPTQDTGALDLESSTMRRVARRLMPLIIVCYLVAYIDRSNVSIAALTMNEDIGLTAAAYGLGAGLFFVTYIIFEIPSNLALHRFGARRWIARIMITWGIVAACMALVVGEKSFYTVRLLLGAAEAGFTPGIIFYLSQWFPKRHRARAMGRFYVGAALATVIGAPLSGLLLNLDGLLGLAGWKWLFVVSGIPAVVLGFIVLRFFTDYPAQAHWLPERNREWLVSTMTRERDEAEAVRKFSIRGALFHPGTLLLALFFFLYSFNSIGLTLWMPQVIKGTFGTPSNLVTTLLTAIPYAFAVIFMLIVGRQVDRGGRRHIYMAVPMALAGVLLVGSVAAGQSLLGFLLLAVSTGFAWSAVPALWSTATAFTSGVAAAAAVALINSTANIAGVAVPPLIGRVREATGSFAVPLLLIAGAMLAAAAVALVSNRYTHEGSLAASVTDNESAPNESVR
ncbi:MFS transporter [Mycobacterium sp. 21AC1]|uniref:MFS transporter n=1 Tax=[Mycobacterium] appelbergii TaxID=2939269 RepID=UPI002938F516|nr:MFS transporter [Mycobacterium sp. 21AC1]MDV3124231.1 MFS transporter [Mycobacterium sp. 21AC1]